MKLHQALINEVDDNVHTSADDNVHTSADDNVHTSADDNVHTGSVEYIGNNVISTDAPTKLTDVMFFGIVKGW